MKLTYILALLALTLPARAVFELGSDGPGGFSVWHEDHWDVNGIHVDPPQSVPEASPTLVLTLAAAALLHGRCRK
ncbi:hypothetical protein UFOVP783_6 [uncultured Caudovirales phage]|uniref:Uncharacterized protein n=1 Tax=uncultured Caudovirales phage TaxID=2100421 RepID=A0A6J5NSW0_9CAUD|nr:hypothetical protein UFOVP783_6 [uncultured Caudovirales phage]